MKRLCLLTLILGLVVIGGLSCRKSGPSYAVPLPVMQKLPDDHPVSLYNDALRQRKPIVMVFNNQIG